MKHAFLFAGLQLQNNFPLELHGVWDEISLVIIDEILLCAIEMAILLLSYAQNGPNMRVNSDVFRVHMRT